MTAKELLKNRPLQILITKQKIDLFNMLELYKEALIELNRDYVLLATEDRQENGDIILNVECPTTNYAMSFFAFGKLMGKKMLSL